MGKKSLIKTEYWFRKSLHQNVSDPLKAEENPLLDTSHLERKKTRWL